MTGHACGLLSFNGPTCLETEPADLGSDPGSSTSDGGAVGGSPSVKGGSWRNRARGAEVTGGRAVLWQPLGLSECGALFSCSPRPLRPQELRARVWRTWACWGEGVRDCGYPPTPGASACALPSHTCLREMLLPHPRPCPLLSFLWKFLHFPYKNG